MQNLRLIALLVWRYDVTKVPSKEENKSSDSAIYPWKTSLTLKKMSFYVQNRSSRPKIDPPCQFQQFSSRGKFFHFQFLGCLDDKRAAATPLIDQFC